jgi:opacity protein-like surface antigen
MIRAALCLTLLLTLTGALPAYAFDPDLAFQKGTWIASFEGGGGKQNDLENHGRQSNIELFYTGARISYMPWDTFARGSFFHGTFEPGLEAIYQHYTKPNGTYYAGLALSGRYHFLSLGRLVPYIELLAAAGGTNLKVMEIDSTFAFWLAGGLGASYFVTDNVALYAGYRMIHVSNGHTKDPNRGFEADTGVAGVSFYFK